MTSSAWVGFSRAEVLELLGAAIVDQYEGITSISAKAGVGAGVERRNVITSEEKGTDFGKRHCK